MAPPCAFARGVPLVDPQAGLAFDLETCDPSQNSIPPFATLASKNLASQMVEAYWMALTRDVPFRVHRIEWSLGVYRTARQWPGDVANSLSRISTDRCPRSVCFAIFYSAFQLWSVAVRRISHDAAGRVHHRSGASVQRELYRLHLHQVRRNDQGHGLIATSSTIAHPSLDADGSGREVIRQGALCVHHPRSQVLPIFRASAGEARSRTSRTESVSLRNKVFLR
jgi:hypothetical protein